MIVPDYQIKQWATNGGLTPFDSDCINPASVDLRWSGRVKVAVGMALDNEKIWHDMTPLVKPEGFWFLPGLLYLADSLEFVKIPKEWSSTLVLKSSMGRLGLEHLHAGWAESGFHGTLTWELKVLAPWPVLLKPEQKVMQLVFETMASLPENDYSAKGRYQNQREPTPAKDIAS